MIVEQQDRLEVASDGDTVWVNNPICIGRFCRYGIDLEPRLQAQIGAAAYPEAGNTLIEWRLFQALFAEHYGITISEQHRPSFLRGVHAEARP